MPIDDVFARAKASVAEGRGPKRRDVLAGVLRDRDAHDLDLGRVRLKPERPSLRRDPAGQLDIALGQRAVLARGGPDRDALGSDVHIGEVADALRDLGESLYAGGVIPTDTPALN